ncbi:HsdM family class I SAM-dependent methyltransferase [Neisseria elongata]|jgi:type IIS restriction enzyme M protein|uniref:site-specific DNA-methyltransferase (adenine-specific) n=1 Tax=Neisseria elongata subsp. nitroreducens TaxID=90367 RepID=A0A9X0ZSZ9_NEIEL|nr:N-6 DNA methylase [Neisseria elongata]MBS9339344.1 N-6 DNA methylase [Neisseria elongata subsp. nitroreducens]MBS9339702.1 N-6 DNA methylase [Neisseria elongata subsp. nitroreducens]
MAKTNSQSVEPNIADLANGWLKSYGLDYKLEQETLNSEIDKALTEYHSKSGGSGGNRPDAKLLLRNPKTQQDFPILIEYKGYQDKLVKLDSDGNVENRNAKNEPLYKNINGYAVNGAVHYANAILHHTAYTDIIAIGITGHKDKDTGSLKYQIGVYYVAKSNLGAGQKVGEFDDLSFLALEHFSQFVENKIKTLTLTSEELDKIKAKRESEINISLKALNEDIYKNEKGLGENDRVYLVAASIIATIGIPGKVPPLEKAELKSSTMVGNRDGDILVRHIEAFLSEKNLPKQKQDLIVRTLSNTLLTDNINKVKDGESQLKRVFGKIVDDLGIYYKIGLTTDFTGKLFNEMYSWLGFSQDKLNDVVLTPAYVATLLAKLARVNKDSYVWDFATGSAGLLVAAMNEMLNDAKNSITSPEELRRKEVQIKAEQLLGLELLSSIYMLAILNMILMGDGSANILNKDSLADFNGKYGFGDTGKDFPADAFILNPPYSAKGNGMVFVEKALGMMNKGYAAVIIQNSAGSGKARDNNREILKNNTLLASIKMPIDLFIGKSSVQTNIYVFKVGEPHDAKSPVRFIDFSNDGYTRTNRKKASNNLKDTDNARGRYEELVNLVKYGASELNIFSEKEFYEGKIDPNSGADWNQSAPIDTKPTLADFQKTVSDYLAWEVAQLLRQPENGQDDTLGK